MQERKPDNPTKTHTHMRKKEKKKREKDQHKNKGAPEVRRMKNTTGNVVFSTNTVHPSLAILATWYQTRVPL